MAIGTLAAIGLGLGVAGKVADGISSGNAAGKASDTALAVAEKNNALTEKMYGKNESNLSPFMNTGTNAMGMVNALLGVGGAGGGTDWAGFVNSDPWRVQDYERNYAKDGMSIQDYGKFNYDYDLKRGRSEDANYAGFDLTPFSLKDQATKGFDQYRGSTGYQFRLGEGMNALNSGYAGRGTLQSGAAMKGALEYGQNFASGEFNNYLGALTGQQGLGLSGASALAGVGQNYVNTVSANNNSAGSAAANAILAKGANNPFGGALGMLGGGLYGYGK